MSKISCEVCGKCFAKKRLLRLHSARNHIPKSEWTFECEICYNKYADQEILERHLKTHDVNRPSFLCTFEDCNKEFLSEFGRQKHINTIHKERVTNVNNLKQSKRLKSYLCPFENCQFSCSKHHLLTQHSYEHTGILPFTCNQCEKKFKSLAHKTRHEKIHNGYSCPHCDEVLKNWTELLSHKAIQHAKEFKCNDCKKVFYSAHKLKQHSAMHAEERTVFKCTKCERTFTRKHGLKTHVDVYHNGKRQFVCPSKNCNKVYAHRHSLNKHIKNEHRGVQKPKKMRKDKIDIASRILGFNTQLPQLKME